MKSVSFRKDLVGVQDELLRFAYKLTTDREEANDLLQETSLKALDNEDKYMPDTNFKGWMYTIMRNIFTLALLVHMLYLVIQFSHGTADFFAGSSQGGNRVCNMVHANPVIFGKLPYILYCPVNFFQLGYRGIYAGGAFLGSSLDIADKGAKAPGQGFCFICKLPDFLCDDGKSPPCVPGACCFYRSI